jgi:hypothetical protein
MYIPCSVPCALLSSSLFACTCSHSHVRALLQTCQTLIFKFHTPLYKYHTLLYKYRTLLYKYRTLLYKYRTLLYKYCTLLYKYHTCTTSFTPALQIAISVHQTQLKTCQTQLNHIVMTPFKETKRRKSCLSKIWCKSPQTTTNSSNLNGQAKPQTAPLPSTPSSPSHITHFTLAADKPLGVRDDYP